MPWTPDDGPQRHTRKANTPRKRRQWATVANDVLAKTGDEGRAVRAANAAVAKYEFSAAEERRLRKNRR
jgi:hypothetical protein